MSSTSIPATFYQRTAAWALDALPFQIAFMVVQPSAPVFSEQITTAVTQTLSYLLAVTTTGCVIFMIYTVYHLVMEKNFSTTLGKFAIGLEVIYPQLNWKNVVQRFLGCILSWLAFNLGHLMIFKKAKALHDQLSNTAVVYAPHSSFGNTAALSAQFHKAAFVCGWLWIVIMAGISAVALCTALFHAINSATALA